MYNREIYFELHFSLVSSGVFYRQCLVMHFSLQRKKEPFWGCNIFLFSLNSLFFHINRQLKLDCKYSFYFDLSFTRIHTPVGLMLLW